MFIFRCKGPFTRSDLRDPILGSENWTQAFRRSDLKVPFLLLPYIFRVKCRMKIEHVLFPSVFFKITDWCAGTVFTMFKRSDFPNQQKPIIVYIYLPFLNCGWLLIREVQWFYWVQESWYQQWNLQWGCRWWDSNSQPLGYKLSALAIELNSSNAIAGKELSLSSWCVASSYIFIIFQLWLTSHQLVDEMMAYNRGIASSGLIIGKNPILEIRSCGRALSSLPKTTEFFLRSFDCSSQNG